MTAIPPANDSSSPVVVFTGHMMDKVGRVRPKFVPRFPKEKEMEVTSAIRAALLHLKAKVGYCSAACGGDLIFIEQMLTRGGEVHVVLPYAEDQFIADSIQSTSANPNEHFQEDPGQEWQKRYALVRSKFASLTVLGNQRPHDNAMASDCCNRVFLGMALLKAKELQTTPHLIALWDGWSGDAPGGTRSMVKLANARGVSIHYLPELHPASFQDVVHSATPPPGTSSQPARPSATNEPPQQICAILFADVVKFSELDERKLPSFIKNYLEPLATLVQRARQGGYGPLDFNTWGDGLFCIFDSMSKAGQFALLLTKLTNMGTWQLKEHKQGLKVRVALHAGPVYRIPDPLFPKETFMGANISKAARLEPVTRDGAVFCTREFAALAEAEGVQDFTCHYVAELPLKKGADGISSMAAYELTSTIAP